MDFDPNTGLAPNGTIGQSEKQGLILLLAVSFFLLGFGCATPRAKEVTLLPDLPEVTRQKVLVAATVYWATTFKELPAHPRFVDDELFASPEIQSLKSLRVFKKSERIGPRGFYLSQEGLELKLSGLKVNGSTASVQVSSQAAGLLVVEEYILSGDNRGNWRVIKKNLVLAS